MSYEHQRSAPGPEPCTEVDPGLTATNPQGSACAQVLIDGDLLSCVVYTKPDRGPEVARHIESLPGVQVHGGADIDKLVVTVEDVADRRAADTLGALQEFEGVVNSVLIYHFAGQALASRPAGDAPA